MPRPKLLLAAVLAGGAFSTSSCTLAKPLVCAVTTPVFVIANADTCCCDPRGAACAVVALAAVGAVGGLVTGIISDINYLTGDVEDPARNLHDPFATNTSRSWFE